MVDSQWTTVAWFGDSNGKAICSKFWGIETTLYYVVLTSSQVLTERKSFEAVVRSSLPAMVDPRVVSVALELPLLPSVALELPLLPSAALGLSLLPSIVLGLSLLSSGVWLIEDVEEEVFAGMVLTSKAKETALGLE